MKDHLLSFEMDQKAGCLMIHGDAAGLQKLGDILARLINATKPDHFNHEHLKTPAWAGYELSEENKGGEVLNHVKVYCWKGTEPQV